MKLGDPFTPKPVRDAGCALWRRNLLAALDAGEGPLVDADEVGELLLRQSACDPELAQGAVLDHSLRVMLPKHVCQADSNVSDVLHRSKGADTLPLVDYDRWLKMVGNNIRRMRDLRGVTQGELGDDSGSDQPGISRLERGLQGFEASTLHAIARKLKVQPWQLLHDDFHPQFLPEAMTPAAAARLHELEYRERMRAADLAATEGDFDPRRGRQGRDG